MAFNVLSPTLGTVEAFSKPRIVLSIGLNLIFGSVLSELLIDVLLLKAKFILTIIFIVNKKCIIMIFINFKGSIGMK